MFAVLTDIAADPERLGSRAQPELGKGVRVYHLRHSRTRAGTGSRTVRAPRHFVVYRHAVPDVVGVGRILHDAMDLERHPPEDFGDAT